MILTRIQTQSTCGDTDKACKATNRCLWSFNEDTGAGNMTDYPKSWDAYAFRPPLPTLRSDYLTSSVYMNVMNAENRAAAALYLAGLAGPHHKKKPKKQV